MVREDYDNRQATLAQITSTFNADVSDADIEQLGSVFFGAEGLPVYPALDSTNWTMETVNVWCGSKSYGYHLFRMHISVQICRRPHEANVLRCQQDTVQTASDFIMIWGVFTWHGFCLLLCLNMSLMTASLHYFVTICIYLWTPTTMIDFRTIIVHVGGPMLPRIDALGVS